jgi:NurA-like 5'-3' nuclease
MTPFQAFDNPHVLIIMSFMRCSYITASKGGIMSSYLGGVEEILKAKEKIANGRDLMRELGRYLQAEAAVFKKQIEKKADKSIEDKISTYANAIELISKSINEATQILKPVTGLAVLTSFLEISDSLVENIKTIKGIINKFTGNLNYRFRGIIDACDDIINNTIRLRTLVVI